MSNSILTPFQDKLPSSGPEREALREKGQFWTPDWVAQAMVAYALGNGTNQLFDPAVGAGAFFRAAKALADEVALPDSFALLGTEIDPNALVVARETGLTDADLGNVQITDFVLDPPIRRFQAIVANPPYVRHHRLSNETKARLKQFCKSTIGVALDGRAGLHVYFLIRALQLLEPGGRLAFIMPADTCEGVFAPDLWKWVTRNYKLDAIVTFAPDASPFPKVDTNPIIFMIAKSEPEQDFWWVRCDEPGTSALKHWVLSHMQEHAEVLAVHRRRVREGLETGLSRFPLEQTHEGPFLSDFARVIRGIATGANEFFLLTKQQVSDLRLPSEFLAPAIGRTRDVEGDAITVGSLQKLDKAGRATLLLSLPGQPIAVFPLSVQYYLKYGEQLGIHQRTLVATRRPWYKMEVREVPPILFAYLGRRNARFIRNFAGALPLTGFLCVFPLSNDRIYLERLWSVISHPDTLANLTLVGKSYGSGAIKVEPRALEKLPIPRHVLIETGFQPIDGAKGSMQLPFELE